MATSARPRRSPASGRGSAREAGGSRENEYDLLTAALIGAAIGAGISLLIHRLNGDDAGPFERVGKRADYVIDRGGEMGRRARRELSPDRIGKRLGGAGDMLREIVEDEIQRGLSRAISRQKKRFGL